MRKTIILLLVLATYCSCSKKENEIYKSVNPEEYYSGGDPTVFALGFSVAAPNLSASNIEKHDAGDVDFEQPFVTVPAPDFGGFRPCI